MPPNHHSLTLGWSKAALLLDSAKISKLATKMTSRIFPSLWELF
jgi:hypothetical protein